jgi:DNA-binding response OmpR family regulator
MTDTPAGLRLVLVHWNPEEAESLADALRDQGWSVLAKYGEEGLKLKDLRVAPPDVVVISLRRQAAQGLQLAADLRSVKWMRHIPIIFLDGTDAEIEAAQLRVPTAGFATWPELPALLEAFVG